MNPGRSSAACARRGHGTPAGGAAEEMPDPAPSDRARGDDVLLLAARSGDDAAHAFRNDRPAEQREDRGHRERTPWPAAGPAGGMTARSISPRKSPARSGRNPRPASRRRRAAAIARQPRRRATHRAQGPENRDQPEAQRSAGASQHREKTSRPIRSAPIRNTGSAACAPRQRHRPRPILDEPLLQAILEHHRVNGEPLTMGVATSAAHARSRMGGGRISWAPARGRRARPRQAPRSATPRAGRPQRPLPDAGSSPACTRSPSNVPTARHAAPAAVPATRKGRARGARRPSAGPVPARR